jgi:hypothetical protein
MRTVTRNLILAVGAVAVILLALGAVPSYVTTGDPYSVEATTVEKSGPSIDADTLSERRFPYTFGAITAAAAGDDPARSEPYYTGPGGVGGFKDAFTHTPFEEYSEFEDRNEAAIERSPDSPVGDVVHAEYEGQRYRLEIVRISGGDR